MRILNISRTNVWRALEEESAKRPVFALESAMQDVGRCLPRGWPIGLESELSSPARYGEIVMNAPDFLAGLIMPDKGRHDDPKYVGVPIELVLQRVWRAREVARRDAASEIRELAKLLIGVESFRTMGCSATNLELGLRIEYETPQAIEPRMRMLSRKILAESTSSAIHVAIGAMMEMLVIHPFDDGNGRVARALFQLVLADRLSLPAPIFPLLPLMFYQRRRLYEAYLSWELRGDCSEVCSLVERWLWLLVRHYETVLASGEPAAVGASA